MINVEVEKNASESGTSTLRRFTKKVQEAGILSRVRGIKYSNRTLSHYKKKKGTLERIRRNDVRNTLLKLGKIQPVQPRMGRR